MTLVDHWDLEDVRFNILSRTNLASTGCWEWKGGTSGQGNGAGRGYGRMWYRGQNRAAHRIAFVAFNGPIHGNKQVDHICTNRLCCNPDHLQLVTAKRNCKLRDKRNA